jgi:hypothetical protein
MVGEMMDDDLAMLRACFEAGLFCLGVGGLWVIVSVVREWWRGHNVKNDRLWRERRGK